MGSVLSSNGKKYRYTNRKHAKLTKRLKYQRLIKNYKNNKNKNDISKVENKIKINFYDYENYKNFANYKYIFNCKIICYKYKYFGKIKVIFENNELVKIEELIN